MRKKPDILFDREREWWALVQFVEDQHPGAQLAVVRGRRRHGKSALLRALVTDSDGFYYQAIEGVKADQLRDLGRVLARHLGLSGALELTDWTTALDVLLGGPAAPRVVVLDEISYLVEGDPSLPSVLQRWLDANRAPAKATRLIVCGSALSVMSGLLVGQAPLRGRASVELPIRALDYRQAAAFQGISEPALAASVFAVIGGAPGYSADLLAGDVPRSSTEFSDWMVRGPLSTSRPFLYEARHLLDEPGLRDRSMYLSVLAELAGGATRNSEVAARLRRSTASVAQPLGMLADLELVERRDDLLRAQRPIWALADPLLRLWAAVLRPDWTRLEQGLGHDVWRDAEPAWRAQILGPTVEQLARTWTSRFARSFGPLRRVGRTVINDPAGRAQHELDIVGLSGGGDTPPVAVLGEAKAATVGVADLRRLRRARELLAARGLAGASTRLVLVGLTGPTPELMRERTPDVEIVDAERLYGGD